MTITWKPRLKRGKLKELVLYISEKSSEDANFGLTKLNKALFCADFARYFNTGKPITGSRYQKLPYGPAPRALVPIMEELQAEGRLAIESRRRATHLQRRPVALDSPNLDLFSAQEISLVDEIIEILWNHTATSVSEWSHTLIGWEVAEMQEDIPYQTALVGPPRPLTSAEIEYGKALARGEIPDSN